MQSVQKESAVLFHQPRNKRVRKNSNGWRHTKCSDNHIESKGINSIWSAYISYSSCRLNNVSTRPPASMDGHSQNPPSHQNTSTAVRELFGLRSPSLNTYDPRQHRPIYIVAEMCVYLLGYKSGVIARSVCALWGAVG